MTPTPTNSPLSPKNIRLVQQWLLKSQEHDYQNHSQNLKYFPKSEKTDFADERAFLKLYPKIVEKVVTHADHGDMEQINAWLSKVMECNVPNGKRVRGLATVSAYRSLINNQTISEEQLEQACILGWCVELLHAAQKMNTNIIGDIRECRGSPSWHVRDNLGPVAFNDAVLLIGALFYILKEYFEEEDYYLDLLNIFHEAQLFRAFGQGLERKTNVQAEINYLNPSRHEAIVKYQVSYFSFYLPLAVAMSHAGFQEKDVFLDVKSICFKLGYLYQVAQDRKHCESDIVNGTPSWFLFQAIRKANRKQKLVIRDCYGCGLKGDQKVTRMMELYKEMNMDSLYASFVAEQREDVTQDIKDFVDSQNEVPVKLFTDLLNSTIKHC